ncbi:MAG: hypothetical protein MJ203_04130 [archaeon]|nr:hypothetical protein [archaeon]
MPVKVTDKRGNPVNEGIISLSINGVIYTAPVVNGVAIVEGILHTAGKFVATVSFISDNYEYAETFTNVTVTDNSTSNSTKGILSEGIPMEHTGIPLVVLLISLVAVCLGSIKRKF